MDARRIRTAELFAVGTELTTGETRDSNGGELAASLAAAGVWVRRIAALPDDLALVTDHFREALEAVDLVVTTGGLGPTPDDLTREALAAAIGEEPAIDADLEAWLRATFARRGTRMPDPTLKQAWLVPSATAIPNDNGTAPGWWVEAAGGSVAVLLPGPPREMRPMWHGWVLPRLRERGLGDGRVVRTLRTYGIGESVVVERLGEALLRRPNPVIATYARADWLDIRISAVDEPSAERPDPGDATESGQSTAAADGGRRLAGGRRADELLEEADAHIRAALPGHVWAEGETTWAEVVAKALDDADMRLATFEAGTRSELSTLLAEVPRLAESRVLGRPGEGDPAAVVSRIESLAAETARGAGVELGLAVVAVEETPHIRVHAAVAALTAGWTRHLELPLFQHGAHGRFRAAVAAAAFLVESLREAAGAGGDPT